MVEAELNRMCINPMQDKVNNIRGMAAEAKEEFDAAKAQMGSKALIKLRGELLRLYGDQQKLASEAQSDSERQMTGGLLTDLESTSRQAYEAVGFTYALLEQLAVLQQKEGNKRRSAEVFADSVYFGDSKTKEEQEPPASAGGPVEAAGGDPFGLPDNFSPNFGEPSDDGSLPF